MLLLQNQKRWYSSYCWNLCFPRFPLFTLNLYPQTVYKSYGCCYYVWLRSDPPCIVESDNSLCCGSVTTSTDGSEVDWNCPLHYTSATVTQMVQPNVSARFPPWKGSVNGATDRSCVPGNSSRRARLGLKERIPNFKKNTNLNFVCSMKLI